VKGTAKGATATALQPKQEKGTQKRERERQRNDVPGSHHNIVPQQANTYEGVSSTCTPALV